MRKKLRQLILVGSNFFNSICKLNIKETTFLSISFQLIMVMSD